MGPTACSSHERTKRGCPRTISSPKLAVKAGFKPQTFWKRAATCIPDHQHLAICLSCSEHALHCSFLPSFLAHRPCPSSLSHTLRPSLGRSTLKRAIVRRRSMMHVQTVSLKRSTPAVQGRIASAKYAKARPAHRHADQAHLLHQVHRMPQIAPMPDETCRDGMGQGQSLPAAQAHEWCLQRRPGPALCAGLLLGLASPTRVSTAAHCATSPTAASTAPTCMCFVLTYCSSPD